MEKHDASLNLHTKVVAHKDIEVKVRSDDAALGTLLVSKGNVEWLPANNHVNRYRFSWERFASLMGEHGKPVRNS
ncbi:hypothetical protein FIU83_00650 [Halomonas sp. THAF5a]|uniref:hypothetical protein n=1 Tax=Halomonas sp. THAF5a TaxID=2587844 RepID=UPI001268D5C6|nr:hypothetical protein [Halomonas sp. THAF5a]QFU00148.1 hypothetical protein FIU83_00650 [Halomonas sp. THAF5a]